MNLDTVLNVALSVLSSAIFGSILWILKSVSKIKTDIEVIKVQIKTAIELENDIKYLRESVIRLDERQQKCNKDINAVAQKAKKLMEGG